MPTDGVTYHDTLSLPSVYCKLDCTSDHNKRCTSIDGHIVGGNYNGNAWDEVIIYFDGREIASYRIPFEYTSFDLGTFGWDSEHPFRIMIYTRGRTDCYIIGGTFKPHDGGSWSYTFI